MKAARKVGDAKKHECMFPHHPPKASSDPPRSKTRIHGLIRNSLSVIPCVFASSSSVLRCTERFIQKSLGVTFRIRKP